MHPSFPDLHLPSPASGAQIEVESSPHSIYGHRRSSSGDQTSTQATTSANRLDASYPLVPRHAALDLGAPPAPLFGYADPPSHDGASSPHIFPPHNISFSQNPLPTMAIPPLHGRSLAPPSSDDASQSSSRRSSVDEGEHSSPPSSSSNGRVREKRHGCSMCHKAFDRPSTLNKHFLVHTGEKPFVCEICGHRFGVASNLNRHVRKCVLRPVNNRNVAGSSSNTPARADVSSESGHADSTSPTPTLAFKSTLSDEGSESPDTSGPERVPRARAGISTVEAAGGATSGTTRKRRSRRAPSPMRWVPPSLATFNLGPVKRVCQVPLEPVLPFRDERAWEERDSYEEEPSERPYHPIGWRGRLPGPGLRDIMNTGIGAGRLVFL